MEKTPEGGYLVVSLNFLIPNTAGSTNNAGKEWQYDSRLTSLCISTCQSMFLDGTSPLQTQSFVERCFGLHILLISKCYIRARSCKSETDGLVVS
jgi:hypothetical protein